MIISPWLLFIGGVLFNGWLCRKKRIFDAFVFYTLCLVLFSTATANQYLAIPAVFTCIHYLPLGLLYNLVPGIYFSLRSDPRPEGLYIICIGLLLLMYIDFVYQRKADS